MLFRSITTASASVLSDRPVYDSPAKNLRAADAAVAELSNLTGEEKNRQQLRVNELIHAATQQQAAFARANPGYGSAMYSAGGAGAKSLGHAASSPPGKNRAASVNSSKKNKQLQTYDPAFAGKQIAGQADVGQNIGRGSQNAGHGGPNHPDGQRRPDRKSTRLNSSHITRSRMPSSA